MTFLVIFSKKFEVTMEGSIGVLVGSAVYTMKVVNRKIMTLHAWEFSLILLIFYFLSWLELLVNQKFHFLSNYKCLSRYWRISNRSFLCSWMSKAKFMYLILQFIFYKISNIIINSFEKNKQDYSMAHVKCHYYYVSDTWLNIHSLGF